MIPERERAPGGAEQSAPLGGVGAYLVLGWQIATAFLVYPAIGFLLDLWLKTRPWLLIAGLVLGLVAVFARIQGIVVGLDRRRRAQAGKRQPGGTSAPS